VFPLDDNSLFFGFGAVGAGQPITVRVEALSLQRLNPSVRGGADYISTLEAHRGFIFKIARAKYEQNIVEPDRSVLVRDGDVAQSV
jgi:hypothetical protein